MRETIAHLANSQGRGKTTVELTMIQTVEAVIDATGHVRLLGPVQIDAQGARW